jgi:branched-chain amino acid transport system permease protein
MNDILFLIVNGITVAAIYGLIAVAVSITWSALGLLNLSYGFIFSFAGYGAWLKNIGGGNLYLFYLWE